MRTSKSPLLCALALLAACAPAAPSVGAPDPNNTKTGSDMPTKQSDNGSCGAVTAKGVCVDNGSVMRWCDGAKKLRESDCAYDAGFTCKVVNGEAKCVDASTGGSVSGSSGKPGSNPGTGCGNIPADGVCWNGTSVMKWCRNNTVLETDCAYDTGYVCQESNGIANCVDTQASGGGGGTPNGCGSVPAKGLCVNGGSKMQWCQSGTLMETDCAYDPKNTCKMINGEAECVPVGGGGSPGTPPTPPPLGGIDYPCWTYRDCQYDLECSGATPSAQGKCACLQGACMGG